MPSIHQLNGRIGAFTSWANTVDRSARTAPARKASPASLDYWLERLDPERFADASDDARIAAAEAARAAHFAAMAKRSADARRSRKGRRSTEGVGRGRTA